MQPPMQPPLQPPPLVDQQQLDGGERPLQPPPLVHQRRLVPYSGPTRSEEVRQRSIEYFSSCGTKL